MGKYIYIFILAIFFTTNISAQDSCRYVGGDFEVFNDVTEAFLGPGTGVPDESLILPENHTSFFRFFTMNSLSIFLTPGSAEYIELWSAGFGLEPSPTASTGSSSLKIGGDDVVDGADFYTVNFCNVVPDSITMSIMHIGDGSDTLTLVMVQDSTITGLPADSSEFNRFASYSNFQYIKAGTENEFTELTVPVINTGNIPNADTIAMLLFVQGNLDYFNAGGESHFLIDNIQFRSSALVVDADMDGFNSDEDCDDNNAMVNPDAMEIPYNGIDDDCDPMTLDDDLDMDGFNNDEDCDDSNASVNPDILEIPYNGIDDDCDPMTLDDDLDMDGFNNDEDCDDSNAMVNPDILEIPYNGIDDDCDSLTLDDDLDMDGFNNDEDCDDNNAMINPDIIEIPYNGIDDDCDSLTLDDDLDMDGFLNAEDCDDNNAMVNPDSIEIPYNGLDDDCDSLTLDDDLDMDGFLNADDCDDMNAAINPDAIEIGGNGIDEDCDGIDGPSSTDDEEFASINISPNPASHQLRIQTGFRIKSVTVFQADGKIIERKDIGSREISLNISLYNAGLHMIQIESIDGKTYRKKMIKI